MLRTLARSRAAVPPPKHINHIRLSRASSATASTAAALTAAAMSAQSTSPWKIEKYTPTATTWPYTSSDFSRQDEDPDTEFYSSPKYVTHIDDNAIEQLARYYDDVLPREGKILDFCSSWVSHYPERIMKESGIEVYGMGLNQAELDRNALFGGGAKGDGEGGRRVVQDLNVDPDISNAFPDEDVKFAASTCTVSIDYLSKPLEVLTSLRQKTEDNGTVHLAISNRAFWHKVVARWMDVDERGRLEMVGDYLWFAGWREVEIVTVEEGSKGAQAGGIWGMLGMKGPGGPGDPLWVVRGRNVVGVVKETGV